jgi:hypothetical protein
LRKRTSATNLERSISRVSDIASAYGLR